MPSHSTRQTLARQWELLTLLPSKAPGLSAACLQEQLKTAGYTVSKRTIERDLIDLSRQFPVQCNDKGIPYGWHWMAGASSKIPGVSVSEALTLQILEGSLSTLIPSHMLKTLEPRFQQAKSKLQSLSAEIPAAAWVNKVAYVQPEFQLLAPEVSEYCLETIQDALLYQRQVDCTYYAAHKDREYQLTLNPLALVQRGQVTYLIATAEPFDDIRQYALHRFRNAQILEDSALAPEDFELQNYLQSGAMQFGEPATLKVEAWINSGLARLLRETPISADMQLVADADGFNMTATVNDSWELQWWILSHCGSIQIRKPKKLRDNITQRLTSALEMHRQ